MRKTGHTFVIYCVVYGYHSVNTSDNAHLYQFVMRISVHGVVSWVKCTVELLNSLHLSVDPYIIWCYIIRLDLSLARVKPDLIRLVKCQTHCSLVIVMSMQSAMLIYLLVNSLWKFLSVGWSIRHITPLLNCLIWFTGKITGVNSEGLGIWCNCMPKFSVDTLSIPSPYDC